MWCKENFDRVVCWMYVLYFGFTGVVNSVSHETGSGSKVIWSFYRDSLKG